MTNASNNAIKSRLTLMVVNGVFCTLLFLSIVFVLLVTKRKYKLSYQSCYKSLLIVSLCIGAVLRLYSGYTYDLPIALFSYASDFFLMGLFIYLIGSLVIGKAQYLECIAVGIASFCLLMILTTAIGIQIVLASPNNLFYLLFFFVGIYCTIKTNIVSNLSPLTLFIKYKYHLAILVLISIFILSYLFSPAPVDADIMTIVEKIGYLFQGQFLSFAKSGVPSEILEIRYPPGLAVLGYGISWLLNIRACESLTLWWFFSYFLLFASSLYLSRVLKQNPFLPILFLLSYPVFKLMGFGAGQVQEFLSYGLGIFLLGLIISDKGLLVATLVLCASVFIHPIVSLPFCLLYLIYFTKNIVLSIRNNRISKSYPIFSLIIVSILYFYFFSIHGSEIKSQPKTILMELSPLIFLQNLYQWLNTDLGYIWFLLLFSPLLFFNKSYNKKILSLFFVWLFGALLIDGLFGSIKEFRFQGNFSTIGVFAFIISFYARSLTQILKNRFIPTILFTVIWVAFFATRISLKRGGESFTTHSDIKLGRIIEKKLSKDAFIVNVGYPYFPWSKYYNPEYTHMHYWSARGNFSRNTLFSRLDLHQLKKPRKSRDRYIKCLMGNKIKIMPCLKNLGATHLFIDAFSNDPSDVNKVFGEPLYRVGNSIIYKL